MEGKYFTIKIFPDDVYNAVGQIIKASQEWEQDFKNLAYLLNLSIKNINTSSLNKLNEALKKNHQISKEKYERLKKVISVRNYINHIFFLEKFAKSCSTNLTYNEYLENLQAYLNFAQDVIFEATDVINNIFDQLEGNNIMRPTYI